MAKVKKVDEQGNPIKRKIKGAKTFDRLLKKAFSNKKTIAVLIAGTIGLSLALNSFTTNASPQQMIQQAGMFGYTQKDNQELKQAIAKSVYKNMPFAHADGTNYAGYIIASGADDGPKLRDQVKNLVNDGVNHVIFSYGVSINAAGDIVIPCSGPSSTMNMLKEQGVPCGFAFTNFSEVGNWNAGGNAAHNLFTAKDDKQKNRTKQEIAIEKLIAHAEKNGATEINVDFEPILDGDAQNLVNFVKALEAAAAPKGIHTTVAVMAKWDNNMNKGYDFKGLAEATNLIYVMAYDLHGASPPVSSINDDLKMCQYINKTVGEKLAKKFCIGTNAYGYIYSDSGKYLDNAQARQIKGFLSKINASLPEEQQIKPERRADSGTPRFRAYNSDRGCYCTYEYADEETYRDIANMVYINKLGGFMVWTVPGMDDDMSDAIVLGLAGKTLDKTKENQPVQVAQTSEPAKKQEAAVDKTDKITMGSILDTVCNPLRNAASWWDRYKIKEAIEKDQDQLDDIQEQEKTLEEKKQELQTSIEQKEQARLAKEAEDQKAAEEKQESINKIKEGFGGLFR